MSGIYLNDAPDLQVEMELKHIDIFFK